MENFVSDKISESEFVLGDSYGNGYGNGYGYGNSYGNGNGNGYGNGDGDGYGDGDLCGVMLNKNRIHNIDGVPTIIYQIHKNVAKGAIVHDDLTLTHCFVVKSGSVFAHGSTLRKAYDSLNDKLFETMPKDGRIQAFVSEFKSGIKYPNAKFFDWHNKLTGSCEFGRKHFAEQHGIDVESGEATVEEFIALTKKDYGGEIIKALEARYKEEQ